MITKEQEPLFNKICEIAQEMFPARTDKSHSKDMTGLIFVNSYSDSNMRWIVLYEGEKRILRGHDTPEVCWICIGENGQLQSMAARNLRKMKFVNGFCFWRNILCNKL